MSSIQFLAQIHWRKQDCIKQPYGTKKNRGKGVWLRPWRLSFVSMCVLEYEKKQQQQNEIIQTNPVDEKSNDKLKFKTNGNPKKNENEKKKFQSSRKKI
ncbi:hypothetical protein DERP_014120 [Dermatophagoides pteronyssinus]|uniref:Uncharacterized protein n=1 Tax=Dermatophagoides pteronyssinus TaxID=6956 RepID=A0ABQ8IXA9_DERPT|nr:hypothetical protein DERP_014120 [Dermatophagoides pteronyssinus]